jgi:hypothetical protein
VRELQTRRLGELADGVLPVGKQLQNPHASRVGEGLEEVGLRLGDRTTRGERHAPTLRLEKAVKPFVAL